MARLRIVLGFGQFALGDIQLVELVIGSEQGLVFVDHLPVKLLGFVHFAVEQQRLAESQHGGSDRPACCDSAFR